MRSIRDQGPPAPALGAAAMILAIVASAMAAAAPASADSPLARDVRARLGLARVSIATLDVDPTPGRVVVTALPVGGTTHVLRLEPHSVRDGAYAVRAQLADGSIVPVAPSPARTMRGRLIDVPGSRVAATVSAAGLEARILLPSGDEYWVEPLAPRLTDAGDGAHAVYHRRDVLGAGVCLADQLADVAALPTPGRPVAAAGTTGGPAIAQLAVDADVEYFQTWGSVEAVEDRVNTVINTMNLQYEADVDIRHVLTTIVVRTAEPDPYVGSDAGTLIFEMRSEWLTNQTGVVRDVAQLFTGRVLLNGEMGVAWRGTVCDTSFGYSVVRSDFGGTLACATDISAHELGHNWDADHCDCPAFTMNFVAPCANRFSPVHTIPEIVAFRDSLACLDTGPAGCPFGEVEDCAGSCAPASWVGDGVCDDGSRSWGGQPVFLNCPLFNNDEGDCDTAEVVINVATAGGSTQAGSIQSGSYVDTHAQDDVAMVLRERSSGGQPAERYSLLSHTWLFDVAPGGAYTFFVDAHHTSNDEGDDFEFSYSQDGATFVPMVVETRTSDDDVLRTFSFPEDVSGMLHVHVEDLDRSPGNDGLDSLLVDHMFVRTGTYGVEDLNIVLGNWGPCSASPCPGDIDQSGTVDVEDLLIVFGAWSRD
ncbi:MAG: M12 family metallo-peptidase [Planctomycetota bacterium]|jgi:hypothetical protein